MTGAVGAGVATKRTTVCPPLQVIPAVASPSPLGGQTRPESCTIEAPGGLFVSRRAASPSVAHRAGRAPGEETAVLSVSESTSPRQALLEARADVAPLPPPGTAGEVGGWVLVIARDAALRVSVAAVLAAGGYEAVTVGEGGGAAAAGAGRSPALTLLDLRAAGPVARLGAGHASRRPGLRGPLVLLSAGPLAELLDATEALGAAGFLRLPCAPDDLLALADRFARPATSSAVPARARSRLSAGGSPN
jgi:CheY-like chemotaxis protein